MDILSVILEGRGGGKKPKNILRHSYRNSSVASLALGDVLQDFRPNDFRPNDIMLPHSEP